MQTWNSLKNFDSKDTATIGLEPPTVLSAWRGALEFLETPLQLV